MKNRFLTLLLPALMLSGALSATAADFSENSPEGIALNFTILQTEAGADHEAEISGLTVSTQSGAEPISVLTLPGTITHDGTTYKITAVGKQAFSDQRISSIIVEEGIVVLKEYSLSSYSIKSVSLPETLETLELFALYDAQIESINIPKNVKSIGGLDNGIWGVFLNAPLKRINVAEDNQYYSDLYGILYNKDMSELLYCPMQYYDTLMLKNGSLTLPTTIKDINHRAFLSNQTIKKIVFPAGLDVHIDYQAFEYSSIESVIFTDSSNFIINGYAFWDCSKLKDIYFGAGVSRIDHNVIEDCWNLKDLKISADNPYYTTDGIAIYDKEMKDLNAIRDSYEGDYTIPSTVTSIFGNSGSSTRGQKINHLTIPRSVTKIGYDAGLGGKIIIENPDASAIKLDNVDAFFNATSITVPRESVNAYKSQWPTYADIINSGDFEMSVSVDEPLSTKKDVMVSVWLKNAEDVIGFQCDIHIPYNAVISTDKNNRYEFSLTDRAKTHTITSGKVTDGTTINGTDDVIRVVSFSMTNAKIKGNDGVLFQFPIRLRNSYRLENTIIAIDNIHLSKPGNIREDLPWVKKSFYGINYIPGDADEDGAVSVVDITSAVSHMIGQTPQKFNLAAVDFDKDETIMINDVTSLVDMVLDFDSATMAAAPRQRAAAADQDAAYTMTANNITAKEYSQAELKVSMTNEQTIIGFQCDITLPEGVTIDKEDDTYAFTLDPARCDDHFVASRKVANKANTVRIVSASLSNAPFSGHEGQLFSCPISIAAPEGEYEVKLSNIILSAEGNQRINVPEFSGKLTVSNSSGIDTPVSDEAAGDTDEVQYYDLQGRPVKEGFHGIAVSKNGKILMK